MTSLSTNLVCKSYIFNVILIIFILLYVYRVFLFDQILQFTVSKSDTNSKLIINTLKVHLKISDCVESYILSGRNPRTRCQRILNILIVHLDKEKNYAQFCHLINMVSITDLSNRLCTGTTYIHTCL